MSTKTHQIHLKDDSPESMAEFRKQVHAIKAKQDEEKKASDEDLMIKIREVVNNLNLSDQTETYITKEVYGNKIGFEFDGYEWKAIGYALDEVVLKVKAINYTNVRGFVRAEKGIRLHKTASPNDEAYSNREGVYGIVYGKPADKKPATEVLVLFKDKVNTGWLKIKTQDGNEGFIEKKFISILPKDDLLDPFTQSFYYVKSGDTFENNIGNQYPNYNLKTGDDLRTIAQAFHLLNQDSKHKTGIVIKDADGKLFEALELGYKASIDPTFASARELYKKIQLTDNHIVRLPNANYIQLQRELGNLSKRHDLFNIAIDVADAVVDIIAGATGLTVGIIEGVLRGIYDAVEGIVELAGTIIDVIKSVITGKFFDDLKELYETISNLSLLSAEDLKELAYGVLGNIGGAIQKTIENWANASAFEKGRTIGIIIGVVVLEVLIAIFTGGSVTIAKWAGKLGKVGKLLQKVAKLGDKVRDKLKNKIPERFKKGDYDKDKDKDGNNWQRWALLQQARTTAELLDANGASILELKAVLEPMGKLYPDLKKVVWDFEHKRDNIYAVTLTASPTKTVDTHFSSGVNEKDETIKLEAGEKGKWNKELSGKLKTNKTYDVDGYLYRTDDLGRVKSVQAKLELKNKGRNTYQQGKSVKLKDGVKGEDDGGHLIAQIFNGPGEQINYVPQKSTLNRGDWKAMENSWARALKEKKEVNVKINNIFDGNSKRPKAQEVKFSIGSEVFTEIFKN